MKNPARAALAALILGACLAHGGGASAAYPPAAPQSRAATPSGKATADFIDWLLNAWQDYQCERYGNWCDLQQL